MGLHIKVVPPSLEPTRFEARTGRRKVHPKRVASDYAAQDNSRARCEERDVGQEGLQGVRVEDAHIQLEALGRTEPPCAPARRGNGLHRAAERLVDFYRYGIGEGAAPAVAQGYGGLQIQVALQVGFYDFRRQTKARSGLAWRSDKEAERPCGEFLHFAVYFEHGLREIGFDFGLEISEGRAGQRRRNGPGEAGGRSLGQKLVQVECG